MLKHSSWGFKPITLMGEEQCVTLGMLVEVAQKKLIKSHNVMKLEG